MPLPREASGDANRVGTGAPPSPGIPGGPSVAMLAGVTHWRAAAFGAVLGLSVLGASVSTTGCAAPTLPLPPPSALVVSAPDASGMVTVTGHADPAAFVFVLNEATEYGVIVHADAAGLFSAQIPASVGDMLSVWQAIGNRYGEQLHPVVSP